MARPLRISYAGALYHIISRGNETREIFIDKRDRGKFLQCLKEIILRYNVKIHTYCLMDNHYHLIMETPHGNIVDAMHYLNSSYTVYFNSLHKRIGHLFQGRYKSLLVEKDPYLPALSRYIHLNPVRKNLVKNPQDYPWSSYRYFITPINTPDFLCTDFILSVFSEDLEKARHLYREFVEDHIGEEVEVIRDNLHAGLIVGSRKFVE
ncbi:MAG: transposase, partial [Candidatus Omnitrophica bacterium]|nr:transposase [Candidatus Omnitrophota bacterium]